MCVLALEKDGSPQAKSMLREFGDDVSMTGFLLTFMSLVLDVKRGIQSMKSHVDRAFFLLVEELQKLYRENGDQGLYKSTSKYYLEFTRFLRGH